MCNHSLSQRNKGTKRAVQVKVGGEVLGEGAVNKI